MQKELKTLRGQDLFGKNAADLCLVPNVKIPHKFKVPDFEKYKGNSCPQSHLVMYARRMSTQGIHPDRDQLRARTQKDRESFKEYAQRWREVAAQIFPPLEE